MAMSVERAMDVVRAAPGLIGRIEQGLTTVADAQRVQVLMADQAELVGCVHRLAQKGLKELLDHNLGEVRRLLERLAEIE